MDFDSATGSRASGRRVTAGDIAGRVTIAGCFVWQAVRILQNWQATGRLSGVFFLVAGSLVVWFSLIRRPAMSVESSLGGRIAAISGTLAPIFFRPAARQLLPDALLSIWIMGGALMAIASIVYLGRNFGIVAAHRGVSANGPYKIVRHPLYASYLLMHVGYICGNVSVANLVLWIVAEGSQVVRILYEERVLSANPSYATYQQRVRWRLVPGLF
jgi:protein-S-isoprenylcysteine O-methyltransferase Ste14